MATNIEAITFDWYGTLATHRHRIGRGRLFSEYLASHGLQSAPWDRRLLYNVFDYYGSEYKPESSDEDKRIFWVEFTTLLFELAQVRGKTANQSDDHADAIRDIFGSGCFELYVDVRPVLCALKSEGLLLAVISNWHRGLDSFCYEMNLSDLLDAVIPSSDNGIEKPDPRIFGEAVRRLGVKPDSTVHVGDSVEDDLRGAAAAGLRAILIDRENVHSTRDNRIKDLYELKGQLRKFAISCPEM